MVSYGRSGGTLPDCTSIENFPIGEKIPLNLMNKDTGYQEGYITSVLDISKRTCDNNKYTGALEVSFWETGTYKDLVAVIPVNVGRGWYAATLASGVGETAYLENGGLRSFYMCNVGTDGKINFDINSGSSGDWCKGIFLPTWDEKQTICDTVSIADSNAMVNRAKLCIQQAASQYKQGKRNFVTECGTFSLGKPPAPKVGGQCQEFMESWKCDLMYNVCDPVVCPTSRCNLGGAMTVDNVVQTGVIGGIALCLPNFGIPPVGGKVLVPVCLTGIHAGLENWQSMMKAVQACMEESLKTGKEIGICDELKSIYLCQFFWNQFSPILKLGVPKLTELITGTTKAGAEYLNVNQAFDNAVSSAKYITDYYGVNMWNAIKARTTSSVGTDICQAFVSLTYPNQINLFDEMTTPESPPQIHAFFSETSLQTITTPPISQYKINWHIYAGKDQSVYYVVTLRQPPSKSYYVIPESQLVASGFIEKGDYVDTTRDMQVAAGYKEVCIQLSGPGIGVKDYCGFGSVGTAFAINYLKENYLKDQVSTEVNSEKECISGSGSLSPLLLTPNIQSGVQEALSPQIYNRGIVRVCSSGNPGAGVEETRWSRVGTCSGKVYCWLDTKSVENSIKNLGLLNMSLSEAEKLSNYYLGKEGNWNDATCAIKFMDAQTTEFKNKINLNTQTDADITYASLASIEDQLKTMITKCINDRWKARAQMEIGLLHNAIVDNMIESVNNNRAIHVGTGGTSIIITPSTTPSSSKNCIAAWRDESGSIISSAVIGHTVKLVLTGTCKGTLYNFEIVEKGGVSFLDSGIKSITTIDFKNNRAETSYIFNKEGNYYFYVTSILPDFISKEVTSDNLQVTLPGGAGAKLELPVFFDYSSAVLTDVMKNNIRTNLKSRLDSEAISSFATIYIEGYASLEGEEQFNKALSADRAIAVKNFINQEFGTRLSSKYIVVTLSTDKDGPTGEFGVVSDADISKFAAALRQNNYKINVVIQNSEMKAINDKLAKNRRAVIRV
jgi:hypothetical protein